MEIIDNVYLEAIKANASKNKGFIKKSCKIILEFSYTLNNLFKFAKTQFNNYEMALWIKYNEIYIQRKKSYFSDGLTFRDIVWVDFGANIGNELSYEHLCVVVAEQKENVFVIPCSSSRIKKAYIKNTNILYPEYMIGEKCDGFNKKTVLILNNAKWISKSRVIRKHGRKLSKTLYTDVYNKLFSMIFEPKQRELKTKVSIIENLNKGIEQYKFENAKLKDENEKLQKLLSQENVVN